MATIANSNRTGRKKFCKHPLRLTALLYLKEALQEERYEECATCIQVALEFGATKQEIAFLLEDSRRMPRP